MTWTSINIRQQVAGSAGPAPGKSALSSATDVAVIKLLLAAKAPVDLGCPLYDAAKTLPLETVALLCDAKANVNDASRAGKVRFRAFFS